MSYMGLRTLPSAESHGPEGTHGDLPGPAELYRQLTDLQRGTVSVWKWQSH